MISLPYPSYLFNLTVFPSSYKFCVRVSVSVCKLIIKCNLSKVSLHEDRSFAAQGDGAIYMTCIPSIGTWYTAGDQTKHSSLLLLFEEKLLHLV